LGTAVLKIWTFLHRKSLVYFEDAEDDPMPRLHFEADWNEIKDYFKKKVPVATKELVGLTD